MWYIKVALLVPMFSVTIHHLLGNRADADGAWTIVVNKVYYLSSLVSKTAHGMTVL